MTYLLNTLKTFHKYFTKLDVTILFTDQEVLSIEGFDKLEENPNIILTDEDFYWHYDVVVNGHKTPLSYWNKLFTLRNQFYSEIAEHIMTLNNNAIRHYLFELRQKFIDFIELISIDEDLSRTGMAYGYYLDKYRRETVFYLTRTLKHKNPHFIKRNNKIQKNGETYTKQTDYKEHHYSTLFLEIQGRFLQEIIDYFDKYLNLAETTSTFTSVTKFDALIDETEQKDFTKSRKIIYPRALTLNNIHPNIYKLKFVYKVLNKNKIVLSEYKSFKNLFICRSDINRVIWNGENSSLNYFIRKLKEEKIIEISKKYIWVVTSNCFADKNGNPFKNTSLSWANDPPRQIQIILNEAIAKFEPPN